MAQISRIYRVKRYLSRRAYREADKWSEAGFADIARMHAARAGHIMSDAETAEMIARADDQPTITVTREKAA